jgi:hypothetical protein
METTIMAKPGRNEPCPCGSGRKYKKCCLSKDEASRMTTTGHTAGHDPTASAGVSEPELPIDPIVGGRANAPTASTAVSKGFSDFARSVGRGLSARSVSELLRETGVSITPYTVARISEDPRSAGSSPRLRQIMERGIRGRWTRKKVAAMPTEAIEVQCRLLQSRATGRANLTQLFAMASGVDAGASERVGSGADVGQQDLFMG